MKDIFEDHYEDLQISPKADQETIERVYRLLAKRYHPDNNDSGSVEKFDIITKAYKVLGQAEGLSARRVQWWIRLCAQRFAQQVLDRFIYPCQGKWL
jgi:preprotein translocase subunit Sec63